MGHELLGEHVRWLTLSQEKLASAYYGSDLFMLASKDEAFGAVIAEAAIAGLPILCNDFPAARYILGERYPGIIDMVREGGLSNALQSDDLVRDLPIISSETKERFSADLLTKDLELFLRSHSR
jgi:glycosyltransferase involved in cell wall biosynthesis